MTTLDLKECFKEDFIVWLVKSNNPKSAFKSFLRDNKINKIID